MSLAGDPSRSPLKKMQDEISTVPAAQQTCSSIAEMRPARQRRNPAMAAELAAAT